jgi:hypothetical protein
VAGYELAVRLDSRIVEAGFLEYRVLIFVGSGSSGEESRNLSSNPRFLGYFFFGSTCLYKEMFETKTS